MPEIPCKLFRLMIFQECFKLIFMVYEQMVQNQNESDKSFPIEACDCYSPPGHHLMWFKDLFKDSLLTFPPYKLTP